jgi:hypothetical protein
MIFIGEGKTSLDSAFLGFSKRIFVLKVIVSPLRGDAGGRGVLLEAEGSKLQ